MSEQVNSFPFQKDARFCVQRDQLYTVIDWRTFECIVAKSRDALCFTKIPNNFHDLSVLCVRALLPLGSIQKITYLIT
jgi:hypothetical protein